HPDRYTLLDGDQRTCGKRLPDIGHRLQYETPCSAKADLGLGQVRLHHRIVAQRTLLAARHLIAGDIHENIEGTAGDATGNSGEADLVAGARTHPVEWPDLAALLVELTGDRVVGTDEEIIQRELVARGAA